ncbi:VIP36-like protein isoform X5 [Varanus komodoensis]|uniref:VIP36-like protein isoform X5 n=1 Tax=Varanus komodoensis TaxID=61221 RepID=UPI001CF7E40D|nr:VIP36-like protein isoform X5 [Varanus komodoensis]
MEEHLKREHSLAKPYQGVGSSTSSLWELMGNAMVMTHFIRLTPDVQSKQGAVWNRVPCYLRDWEMQVHFKIHGQGKKNLNGDGFAMWYTKDRMQPGPVFGSKDNFLGLGVFVDTYPNEEKQQEVLLDIDGKNEWRDCVDIPGVHLPRGYYFGVSSVTGDLSDNHDIISLKLYQLTVERMPEEERRDKEVFLPVVDNMKLPGLETPMEPMSGLALFLIVFFSLVAIVFAIVIGIIVYNKWVPQTGIPESPWGAESLQRRARPVVPLALCQTMKERGGRPKCLGGNERSRAECEEHSGDCLLKALLEVGLG